VFVTCDQPNPSLCCPLATVNSPGARPLSGPSRASAGQHRQQRNITRIFRSAVVVGRRASSARRPTANSGHFAFAFIVAASTGTSQPLTWQAASRPALKSGITLGSVTIDRHLPANLRSSPRSLSRSSIARSPRPFRGADRYESSFAPSRAPAGLFRQPSLRFKTTAGRLADDPGWQQSAIIAPL
jgi:hypothetical protein